MCEQHVPPSVRCEKLREETFPVALRIHSIVKGYHTVIWRDTITSGKDDDMEGYIAVMERVYGNIKGYKSVI